MWWKHERTWGEVSAQCFVLDAHCILAKTIRCNKERARSTPHAYVHPLLGSDKTSCDNPRSRKFTASWMTAAPRRYRRSTTALGRERWEEEAEVGRER